MNIHLSKQLLHWNSLYQQLNETTANMQRKRVFLKLRSGCCIFCANRGEAVNNGHSAAAY